MLKVTVAEVERDLVKQLGINLQGPLGYGTAVLNFNNTNPFSASGQSLSASAITGRMQGSPPRCRPWSRPASFIRSPNRI